MDLPKSGDATSRFLAFVEGLTSVIGHADRAKPLRDYCIGLMMPGERKSVEPMAAITAPERTAAQHQSLLHFVGEGTWSDEKVLAKVREMVLPEIERHGPIEAWIIDDTGFPKKGRHSVGVGRQYCGELGKQDNCQIAVTLSIANHHASLPAAYRLYLPKEWATDRTRRRKAGVPKEITFKTKPAIALEQLRWACVAGLPRGVVLMDAGYGAYTDLRTNITALGLSYVAGIMPQTSVWAPGTTGVSTDMFTQMRFLLQTHRALVNDTFHQRETMPDRLSMTVKQVLEYATIRSAQCIGLDRQIGSITPGKQADLILLRKSDINMRAAADPVSSIVLHAGVSNVDTVMIRGKLVKQHGKLLYRDLGRRLQELDRSSQRLYAGFRSHASAA